MNVKMISTTNSAFDELIGKKGTLKIDRTFNFNFSEDMEGVSFDFRRGYMTSSAIETFTQVEVSMSCYELTINTSNSTYVFRDGELTDEKPYTKEQKLDIMMMYGL